MPRINSNNPTAVNSAFSVLWEWNQTDTSQFGTPNDIGTPTGSLSVATLDLDDGDAFPALIYTHTGATNALRYYPINDLPTLPGQYVIEYKTGPKVGSTYNNTEPGMVALWLDSTHFGRITATNVGINAVRVMVANGGSEDSLTVGSYSNPYRVGTGLDQGSWIRAIIDVENPTASTDPSVGTHFDYRGNTGNLLGLRGDWSNSTHFTALGGGTLVASGWDVGWQADADIRQVGPIFAELGTAGSSYVSFMRILSFTL